VKSEALPVPRSSYPTSNTSQFLTALRIAGSDAKALVVTTAELLWRFCFFSIHVLSGWATTTASELQHHGTVISGTMGANDSGGHPRVGDLRQKPPSIANVAVAALLHQ
jgi:hypothetical protein